MKHQFVQLDSSWKEVLKAEFKADYFLHLIEFLEKEVENQQIIYPEPSKIFAAFQAIPFEKVKVVLIGQDPYHGPGQANGLCFSVNDGIRKPPSLVNIFKELQSDLGIPIPQSGNLESWAKQGVLMLNATLTVRANEAGSHQSKGWELFTDAVIKKLSDNREGLVFLLWGNYAQKKGACIDERKHLVLKAAHPSPLARTGFKGCKHFSLTNAYLIKQGKEAIDWGKGLVPDNNLLSLF